MGSAETLWMCILHAVYRVSCTLRRPPTRWIWADASQLWKVLLPTCFHTMDACSGVATLIRRQALPLD
eukprot:4578990-Pyramimonas_sp.AAC.1